ncbi:SIR2 family protein [Undibacterium parvum]|uniref:Uncharacterized protein n=1 Tax=Undibacterium parvum TaxID=401471 RepID=A0A3Q9BQ31_9BURK|nr:hypothetical protein [Undibacterium parvum]AZP11789.1 hypothetical protein EJN92_07130 [Undibacterium parvum]
MPEEKSPRCQDCGFTVFNNRYPRCEKCGVLLSAHLVLSKEQLAEVFKLEAEQAELRNIARAKAESASVNHSQDYIPYVGYQDFQ